METLVTEMLLKKLTARVLHSLRSGVIKVAPYYG